MKITIDDNNIIIDSISPTPLGDTLFTKVSLADDTFALQLQEAIYYLLDIDNTDTVALDSEEKYNKYLEASNNPLPLLDISFPIKYRYNHGSLESYYELKDFNHLLLFELTTLIHQQKQVRLCARCKKYFILKGNYDTKYCSRLYILKHKAITCVRLATSENYKSKLNDNPILLEYNRAYKRMYSIAQKKFRSGGEPINTKAGSFLELANLRDKYMQLYEQLENEEEREALVLEFMNEIGNKPLKKKQLPPSID